MNLTDLTAPPTDVLVTNWPSDPVATGAAVAGILGLIVAIFALVQTWRLRIAADKSIARERRTAFELSVLRDLLLRVGGVGSGAPFSFEIGALIAALPSDELQLIRVGQNAFDDKRDSRQALVDELQRRGTEMESSDFEGRESILQQTLTDEVRASMEKRVSSARGGP